MAALSRTPGAVCHITDDRERYPGKERRRAAVLRLCLRRGCSMTEHFVEAGRPLPPTAGTGENGFRKFMTKDGYLGQHVDGLSFDDAPFESVIALELARAVLRGTYPRKNVILPAPAVTNDTIEVGVNVFPDQPDSLNCLFTDSGKNALVQFCIDAALNGTPCEGKLEVRLPQA